MQNPIINSIANSLTQEFANNLILISNHITECQDYNLTIYHLTFDNQGYLRDNAPYAITNNSDDFQDLTNALQDSLNQILPPDSSPLYTNINCILCPDTANPYNIINITIAFEHNYQ